MAELANGGGTGGRLCGAKCDTATKVSPALSGYANATAVSDNQGPHF
jgi:hypothetical protein